jgi:DNA-binding XRE family transcriptional regulator
LTFCQVTISASKPKENYPRSLQTLGDHLKKRRLDLGLLKREVAAVLGVCPETITLWEENQTTIEVRYIPRIMDFLGYCPRAVQC